MKTRKRCGRLDNYMIVTDNQTNTKRVWKCTRDVAMMFETVVFPDVLDGSTLTNLINEAYRGSAVRYICLQRKCKNPETLRGVIKRRRSAKTQTLMVGYDVDMINALKDVLSNDPNALKLCLLMPSNFSGFDSIERPIPNPSKLSLSGFLKFTTFSDADVERYASKIETLNGCTNVTSLRLDRIIVADSFRPEKGTMTKIFSPLLKLGLKSLSLYTTNCDFSTTVKIELIGLFVKPGELQKLRMSRIDFSESGSPEIVYPKLEEADTWERISRTAVRQDDDISRIVKNVYASKFSNPNTIVDIQERSIDEYEKRARDGLRDIYIAAMCPHTLQRILVCEKIHSMLAVDGSLEGILVPQAADVVKTINYSSCPRCERLSNYVRLCEE